MGSRWLAAATVLVALSLAGCQQESVALPEPPDPPATSPPPSDPPSVPDPPTPSADPALPEVLPTRPDGFGEVRDTPPALRDRRLPSIDVLPPPAGDAFSASIQDVPAEVAARSTWSPECPVALEDLRYLTVTYRGFDDRPHTGELLVNAAAAEDLVTVFASLYEVRFPIEEMHVVARAELAAPPTGDGNNTSAFVCRPTVGGSRWSEHAFGLAVDVNPFHNPYVRGDLVLPELASAYLDRDWLRPGMVIPGDPVAEAFQAIGWGWGGAWGSSKDWMHFSSTGR